MDPHPPIVYFFWASIFSPLDKSDKSLVMIMTNGIGSKLTNDEKRAHLLDLNKESLIDEICVQEILPPE